ncbi:MAG TPA: mechanosensitive ion channel family protein [Arenibacter sp.]|nr:mechanosensitive ion channel family protein [Arenibacter sp.]
MTDFFELYRPHIIYGILVLVAVLALRMLTNVFYNRLLSRQLKRFPGEQPRAIHLVKRILNTLWIVLGLIALAFLFVGADRYEMLKSNFFLIGYLSTVAVVTIVLAAFTNFWFRLAVQRKIADKADATGTRFLGYVVVFSIYCVGILIGLLAFPALQGISQTALGGAGVLALIAGVASQEALSNLVGGVFIIVFKPFKIGDDIMVTDAMVGTVMDITLRHTVIRNSENKMIVIPNAIINKEKLINYNLGDLKCCEHIEIGISYDSDIDMAKRIMREECENHPLIYDNRSRSDKMGDKPIVRTALIQLGDSSMTIRAWAWTKDYGDSFNLRCEVLERIKYRFDQEGIEIPFPYRTVVIKENKVGKAE